jgi:hypothetical protein
METIIKENSADTPVKRAVTSNLAAFLDIGVGAKVPLIYESCLLQCL